jgi:hypothetical protein
LARLLEIYERVAAEAADGGPVSDLHFRLALTRKFAFYVWKVILPLLLMVFLSWAVFWVEPADLATQVQIAVTTVLPSLPSPSLFPEAYRECPI